MIIVKKPDGSSWFFVDANAVTAAQYKSVFADHKQGGKPEDPVVNIKYDEARSYARTKGGRLLRADEWDAASTTPGFIVTDGLWEWVEPGADKVHVKKHGKGETRPDGAQKDVTFRMAKDI